MFAFSSTPCTRNGGTLYGGTRAFGKQTNAELEETEGEEGNLRNFFVCGHWIVRNVFVLVVSLLHATTFLHEAEEMERLWSCFFFCPRSFILDCLRSRRVPNQLKQKKKFLSPNNTCTQKKVAKRRNPSRWLADKRSFLVEMRKRKYWNPKRLLRLLFPNFRRGKKHLLLLFFYPRPLCFYHCGALFLSFLLLSSFSSKGKKISLLRVQNFFLFPPLFIRGKEIRWRKRMRNEEG